MLFLTTLKCVKFDFSLFVQITGYDSDSAAFLCCKWNVVNNLKVLTVSMQSSNKFSCWLAVVSEGSLQSLHQQENYSVSGWLVSPLNILKYLKLVIINCHAGNEMRETQTQLYRH